MSLLQLIAAFPSRIASKYTATADMFHPFIYSTNELTREAACQLIGFILLSSPPQQRDFFVGGMLTVLKAPFVSLTKG